MIYTTVCVLTIFLSQYVALECLETTYKSCNLVTNICVHAHADARQPIAIIFPHEANLRHALPAEESGDKYDSMDLAGLCKSPSVQALLLRDCNAAGKRSGFKSIEILQAVVLTPEEWTPQTGLVTAAQKLQRRKIEERYREEIKVRDSYVFVACDGQKVLLMMLYF